VLCSVVVSKRKFIIDRFSKKSTCFYVVLTMRDIRDFNIFSKKLILVNFWLYFYKKSLDYCIKFLHYFLN
jgi:hypothetical protein